MKKTAKTFKATLTPGTGKKTHDHGYMHTMEITSRATDGPSAILLDNWTNTRTKPCIYCILFVPIPGTAHVVSVAN